MQRMFGLLHACSTVLDADLLARWRAHLCGLCLTLRDEYGPPARALTNTDAVALAVLVDAQRPKPVQTRVAGPCPLRAMRTAPVVVAGSASMRLAATASVTLAAARAQDHAGERRHSLVAGGLSARAEELVMTRLAPVLRRRAHQDREMARLIDSRRSLLELDGQGAHEASVRTGDRVVEVTTPSAAAAGRIFAASAEVAGRPEHVADLTAVGEAFGSLAHLLDAVQDLDRDLRTGSFNPIVATGSTLAQVRRECGRLVRTIRRHVDRLDLDLDRPDARLARTLLIDGTHRAVHGSFASVFDEQFADARAGAGTASPIEHSDPPGPSGPLAPPPPEQLPPAQIPAPWPDHQPPPPPKKGPRPPFWPNIVPFAAVYCTGYACCAEHENHCTGERHPAACGGGDACSACGDCDCDCCCDGCDCNC